MPNRCRDSLRNVRSLNDLFSFCSGIHRTDFSSFDKMLVHLKNCRHVSSFRDSSVQSEVFKKHLEYVAKYWLALNKRTHYFCVSERGRKIVQSRVNSDWKFTISEIYISGS